MLLFHKHQETPRKEVSLDGAVHCAPDQWRHLLLWVFSTSPDHLLGGPLSTSPDHLCVPSAPNETTSGEVPSLPALSQMNELLCLSPHTAT